MRQWKAFAFLVGNVDVVLTMLLDHLHVFVKVKFEPGTCFFLDTVTSFWLLSCGLR